MTDQALSTSAVIAGDRRALGDSSALVTHVRRLFADVFQAPVGSDDDFFDLGGDSLAGETLLVAFEHEFSVALPLSVLLEASTPRALARAIVAKRQSDYRGILVPVNAKGSGTPLFCTHGLTGTATFSRKIRKVFPDRPIYALRSPGLLPGETPFVSFTEMARRYVEEIRTVRPSGPYLIFGQCGPANVAYEVAQQLLEAGETVSGLILADPDFRPSRSKIVRSYYQQKGRGALRLAEQNPGLSGTARWRRIVRQAMHAAMGTYEPRPYRGKALVVVSSQHAGRMLDARLGYPALIADIETVVVEGRHRDVFGGMTRDAPGALALAMSSFLDRHP
ncbi:MAG: hypothetical protein J0H63_09635 [Rhizobiales bacterium]|nr:hypothetical protein [Hyphomicrobiales bacterium]MBN9010369.1 hypothetical protein [Hyphomicrobiales bacterium]